MEQSVKPHATSCCCDAVPECLAIASVPCQSFDGRLYDDDEALKHGTVFKALDLPFYAGGEHR